MAKKNAAKDLRPQDVEIIALDALRQIDLLCCACCAVHDNSDLPPEHRRGLVIRLRSLSVPASIRRATTAEESVTQNTAEIAHVLSAAAALPWSVLGHYGTDNLAPVAAGRLRAHSAVAATAMLAKWWLELGVKCQPYGDDQALLDVAWEMASEVQRWHHVAALRVQVHQECYRVAAKRPRKGIREALDDVDEAILSELRKAGGKFVPSRKLRMDSRRSGIPALSPDAHKKRMQRLCAAGWAERVGHAYRIGK